jgi:hypothetical protein
MTNSATLRELLKGELNTAIPLSAAYFKSTWFVPIQKQPMTIRFFASLRTRAVSCVFERMPMTWTSLQHQLISMYNKQSRLSSKKKAYLIFSMS